MRMRLFLTFLILSFSGAYAAEEVAKEISGEIDLGKVEEPKIKLEKQVEKLEGSLFLDEREKVEILINEQQQSDLKDIEMLWSATIENNPVIKFSLKKLSVPEEQRRIHSSLMAKSLSALISGASMLPAFMGAHYAVQSASFATARIANNFINKENTDKLKESPLTDTEVIELAGLIEDLQDSIINNYYSYKNALIQLKECRNQLILYNKNYNRALTNNDQIEIAVSSGLYDQQLIEEYRLEQNVKKYQLELQRLAGEKTIRELNLAQYNFKSQGIDPKSINVEKKEVKVDLKEDGK